MGKCKGCGLSLQNINPDALGYTPKLTNKLCERCFKIVNYNYHDDGKYINNNDICNGINQKKLFNFFLCDIFSLNDKTISLYDKIKSPKVFVLTKVDLIPDNINYNKFITRIKNSYHIDEVLLCSIRNNIGLNDIKQLINNHKKVLLCGPTSSGKSSLINYLYNYELTVSAYKNTTQEFITLETDGITIIDAPGFICDVMTSSSKLIKPKSFIINKDYELVIDDIIMSFANDTAITIFLPSNIDIQTRKNRSVNLNELQISAYSDLTIKNIGFIYFKNDCNISINNVEDISIRNSIIGGL